MTQLWGTVALRLANAEILPFDFESYGQHIRQFLIELDDASHVASHIDFDSLRKYATEFRASGTGIETECKPGGCERGLNGGESGLHKSES